MERVRQQVPDPGRIISRRAIGRVFLGGVVAWTSWSWYRTEINPPDNEFTREADALSAQRKQVAKELVDSGGVLQKAGLLRPEILDQSNPKTAQFYQLNKEIREVGKRAVEEEGTFLFRARAYGVTVGTFATAIGALRLLPFNRSVSGGAEESRSKEVEAPLVF